jgi:hypothetical protein
MAKPSSHTLRDQYAIAFVQREAISRIREHCLSSINLLMLSEIQGDIYPTR